MVNEDDPVGIIEVMKLFNTVKAGIRGRSEFVNVALAPARGAGRIGVSTPTKVGGAVARNRARRMVREYYRQSCEGSVAYDLVVNVKSGFAELSYNEAADALAQTISRAIASGKRAGRQSPVRS